jgi:hypothetical protein
MPNIHDIAGLTRYAISKGVIETNTNVRERSVLAAVSSCGRQWRPRMLRESNPSPQLKRERHLGSCQLSPRRRPPEPIICDTE